jgi:hypothetical protein
MSWQLGSISIERLKLALKDKADEDVLLKHFDEAVHFYEAALELEPPDAITNRATSIISSRQSAMALHRATALRRTRYAAGGRSPMALPDADGRFGSTGTSHRDSSCSISSRCFVACTISIASGKYNARVSLHRLNAIRYSSKRAVCFELIPAIAFITLIYWTERSDARFQRSIVVQPQQLRQQSRP